MGRREEEEAYASPSALRFPPPPSPPGPTVYISTLPPPRSPTLLLATQLHGIKQEQGQHVCRPLRDH